MLSPRILEESSPLIERMSPLCQVLALFLFLCHAESSTCSLLHAVPSSVYKQLQFFFFLWKLYIAELIARLGLWTNSVAASFALIHWLSRPAWNKCAGAYLAVVWGTSRILKQSRQDTTPLLLFPTPVAKWCSCPSEEGLKLVNLWVSRAPHGPQPALL